MPDEWEKDNGCNPQVADNNVRHTSGYTMLEMYLDYAMTHKTPMDDGYKSSEEGLEDSKSKDLKNQKILRDGQLLIQCGDKKYTITGVELQ
jgi:hypothetical protein